MAPKENERVILQNVLGDNHPPIHVQDQLAESALTEDLFNNFFEGCPPARFVGLAPVYTERGNLSRLALAVSTKVVIVQFSAKGKGQSAYAGRELLQSHVLCNPDVTTLGFDLGELAIALYTDQSIRLSNGVDVQSACGTERSHSAVVKLAVGDRATVYEENIVRHFQTLLDTGKRTSSFALQAWLAQCLSSYDGMEERFRGALKIDTKTMGELQLSTLAQLERGQQRLALVEATSKEHEYHAVGARKQTAQVRADRFQGRFRLGTTQRLTVRDNASGQTFAIDGQVAIINGRHTSIKTNTHLEERTVVDIVTEGRDRPTLADRARSNTVLHALQRRHDIFDNAFLRYIFNPDSPDFEWPESFPVVDTIPDIVTTRPLNDSQQRAVEHMLMHTDDTRLTIIRGPPGTGKTTVIAAFVCSAVAAGANGIWLMAQSNIAVKNIAEKLAAVGFYNWRLLVSSDFHYDWHEHLYQDLTKNIITSLEFRPKLLRNRLEGVPVILCTISMLSNPKISLFTRANPIKTMVVDEASQIPLGDYVAPLKNFPSIHKICMIGDDKQLPPYGADTDDETNIKSIFEVEHLHSTILLLNVQYRMPPLIGEVVSDVVYDGQLQSNPSHPVPYEQPCCWFVHVVESEEKPSGTSWHNPIERATVLKITEKLQAEGKQFCIITPYDAQRSYLEKELKEAGLEWEDKCFNVDSFQGNERDYVIVSLRGMYIVTDWDFVFGRAANTLVGRMATAWGEEVWVNPEHLTIDV
ncbi:P-loop containing nucleoside triphosphate hydrolase protein [Lentinus tigrinus ALCF2SS1-7]|uniref:P-loop containing nucleoside triphosphate hydrolase protein n=1 Tax=Lentinus tigrinus ALCF2SS1-7 TaxID=1328758 RepID=UPI001165F086|nr:P-loop containing nucleoside triphosphate hydrolase protein [Lentinus tigrinus ALCF2SS1-7]